MLIPKFITAVEAAERDLQEGWWATTEGGDAISGPYPTEEGAIVAIGKRGADQPTGRPGALGPPPQ